MRTREELLKLEADGTSPVSPESWAVLEVLIDIRDVLAAQGKPKEVIVEGPDYKAMVFQLQNAAIDMAAQIKALEADLSWYRQADHTLTDVARVVGLIQEGGSRVFAIAECLQRVRDHVASSNAHEALRDALTGYLGERPPIPNAKIVDLVRALGSLAQDRKDELDRLAACANVCGELVKRLKVPDHTHLAMAVESLRELVEHAARFCRLDGTDTRTCVFCRRTTPDGTAILHAYDCPALGEHGALR